MTLEKSVSGNIKEWRKFRQMSQVDLAKRAKLSQSTIAQIERGTKHPSLATLERIAVALKVSAQALTE